MSEYDYDWSRFDVHMDVAAPIERVFEAWSTGGGLASFFTRTFVFSDGDGVARAPDARCEVGDAYTLAFHHPFGFDGRVLALEAPTHVAITFGDMRVDVRLASCERGTRIALEQSSIALDDKGRAEGHLNCRCCWSYYLLNLRAVLEHGIDLRDEGLPDNPVGIRFGELVGEVSA